MSAYIKTGLYYLDIREFNSDVAHLYEHLIIRTFEQYLIKNGYSNYLYGWVHGQTFRDIMFIEYGFYNPDVENLFVEFINNKARIDYKLVNSELLCIESEAKSNIIISSKKAVINQLKKIENLPLVSLQEDSIIRPYQIVESKPQIMPELLIEKKSAKAFKNITILIGLKDTSLDELITFLRITPIILDVINSKLFSFGIYQNDRSLPIYKKQNKVAVALCIYTIKLGTYTNKEIEKLVIQAIKGINIIGREKELSYYKEGFLTTPGWNLFPIDYYEHTGLIVSKKEIVELLTPKNIHNIIDKLEVKLRNTIDDNWEDCR